VTENVNVPAPIVNPAPAFVDPLAQKIADAYGQAELRGREAVAAALKMAEWAAQKKTELDTAKKAGQTVPGFLEWIAEQRARASIGGHSFPTYQYVNRLLKILDDKQHLTGNESSIRQCQEVIAAATKKQRTGEKKPPITHARVQRVAEEKKIKLEKLKAALKELGVTIKKDDPRAVPEPEPPAAPKKTRKKKAAPPADQPDEK
jgi:transposase